MTHCRDDGAAARHSGRAIVDVRLERHFLVAMAILAALALAVRMWHLGAASVWFDEALEVQRASGRLAEVVVARGIDQDPPAYALALHFWLAAGRGDAWMRLPSALLGAAAAALGAAWGRQAGGPFVGIGTGLFLAVSPVAVHYGQEVNQYAAIVALSCALGLALEHVIARSGRAAWRRYSVISALALFTHYGFAFLVAAHLVPLADHARRGRARVGPLVAHVAVMVGVATVLWQVGLSRGIEVAHLQRRFGGTDPMRELAYLADVVWRDIVVFFTFPFSGGPALHAARACGVLAVVGAIWLVRRGGTGRRAVGVAFLATLALAYFASGMGWYPLGHRYALLALPPYLMAVAGGCAVAWVRSPVAGAGVLAVAAGAMSAFLPQLDSLNPWMNVPREEVRPVLEAMVATMAESDLVYVYYGAEPAFSVYWPELAPPGGRTPMTGRPFGRETAGAEAARIAASIDAGGAIWLVFAHVAPGDHESLLGELVLGRLGRWSITDQFTAENALGYRLLRR